jgi:hypothetical protein
MRHRRVQLAARTLQCITPAVRMPWLLRHKCSARRGACAYGSFCRRSCKHVRDHVLDHVHFALTFPAGLGTLRAGVPSDTAGDTLPSGSESASCCSSALVPRRMMARRDKERWPHGSQRWPSPATTNPAPPWASCAYTSAPATPSAASSSSAPPVATEVSGSSPAEYDGHYCH